MEKILSLHIGHDATAMFIDEKDLTALSSKPLNDERGTTILTICPAATDCENS